MEHYTNIFALKLILSLVLHTTSTLDQRAVISIPGVLASDSKLSSVLELCTLLSHEKRNFASDTLVNGLCFVLDLAVKELLLFGVSEDKYFLRSAIGISANRELVSGSRFRLCFSGSSGSEPTKVICIKKQ